MLRQAAFGEFSLHDTEAKTMTAEQFAQKHGAQIRPWGHAADGSRPYQAVNVAGTDYLWRVNDGEYDGWDRNLVP